MLLAVPDVVERGLVDSLARPGGNITGTSIPSYDLTVKQLQVLKEIDPRLKRVIVVQHDPDRGDRRTVDRLREAAALLGYDAGIRVTDAQQIEQALAAPQTGASCVLGIGNMPVVVRHRVQTLTLGRKLPLIMPWRAWEEHGSSTVVTYGPRLPAIAERTAALVDRIVKGTRPRDLPVEEPTSYELAIDGVVAKALGLTIPPGVRARADEVLD